MSLGSADIYVDVEIRIIRQLGQVEGRGELERQLL